MLACFACLLRACLLFTYISLTDFDHCTVGRSLPCGYRLASTGNSLFVSQAEKRRVGRKGQDHSDTMTSSLCDSGSAVFTNMVPRLGLLVMIAYFRMPPCLLHVDQVRSHWKCESRRDEFKINSRTSMYLCRRLPNTRVMFAACRVEKRIDSDQTWLQRR